MKKFIIIIALLAMAAAVATFAVIDKRVQEVLLARQGSDIPAVYSEPVVIPKQGRLLSNLLANHLEWRRYSKVTGTPKVSGEYSTSESEISVFTRSFKDLNGEAREGQLFTFGIEGKSAINDSPETVRLEPVMISYLGAGEMRAATFRNLDEIPQVLQDAVVAVEDERFFGHHGIDLLGLLRAVVVNLKAMALVQGGSTLTQQLAKNLILTPQRSLSRKVKEVFAALSLESRLSKRQILELYLNEVYLGQEGPVAVHGVSEAAKSFFGKDLADLNAGEAAMIAGIIRAPSTYAPHRHLDKATERRDVALAKMRELKFITDLQYKSAVHSKTHVFSDAQYNRTAPHFIAALSQELQKQVELDAALLGGVRVYTGLSPMMQLCGEQAVTQGLLKIEKDAAKLKGGKGLEGALVAIEPHSGRIRAWVGGRDFSKNQFDHAGQARRQIGSTIKPFLYLTALDGSLNNYRVATTMNILSDEQMAVELKSQGSWVPENYDHQYRGDVTLRYALEHSLNIPAAYIGQKVGVTALARTLKLFQVGDDIPEVPSLALGAMDTSLLRLTTAYAALANGGNYVPARLFTLARNGLGEDLARTEITENQIADENAVYVLTNIMQGVVDHGTGRLVRSLGYLEPVAGKTGTSNDTRDGWFVGFTPDLVAGVWIGYDDNRPMGLTGGTAAVPIWTEFMKCISPYYQPSDFIAPDHVVFVPVDSTTGGLATPGCPSENVTTEVFVKGTEPTRICPTHGDYRLSDQERTNFDPDNEAPPPANKREVPNPTRQKRRFWDAIFGE